METVANRLLARANCLDEWPIQEAKIGFPSPSLPGEERISEMAEERSLRV